MNRLKQKLKSESGASILLALLFFLICALVAAAVLMAAVSNAGKIKSNQEMHQKYLTVSSALELVCDDLLSAEYCGQYKLEITKEQSVTNSDGKPAEDAITYTHTYKQEDGKYSCKLGAMLLAELDGIFAKQMEADVAAFSEVSNIKNVVIPKTHPGTENRIHTLTVETPITDNTIGMQKVQVTVTLKDSYAIYLEARLIDDAAYGMEAELTPVSGSVPRMEQKADAKLYQTEPMTWKLGWITKASQK